VLDAPLELVVADYANVYAQVGHSRKASLAAGERSERAGRREGARVSPDGRAFVTEPVHRPPQPLAARQRTVGYRRR
jgi:hypothetical protein